MSVVWPTQTQTELAYAFDNPARVTLDLEPYQLSTPGTFEYTTDPVLRPLCDFNNFAGIKYDDLKYYDKNDGGKYENLDKREIYKLVNLETPDPADLNNLGPVTVILDYNSDIYLGDVVEEKEKFYG